MCNFQWKVYIADRTFKKLIKLHYLQITQIIFSMRVCVFYWNMMRETVFGVCHYSGVASYLDKMPGQNFNTFLNFRNITVELIIIIVFGTVPWLMTPGLNKSWPSDCWDSLFDCNSSLFSLSLSHRDGVIPYVWIFTWIQLFSTNHWVDWVFHHMWDGHIKSSDQQQSRLSPGQRNQTVSDPPMWPAASCSQQGMLKHTH